MDKLYIRSSPRSTVGASSSDTCGFMRIQQYLPRSSWSGCSLCARDTASDALPFYGCAHGGSIDHASRPAITGIRTQKLPTEDVATFAGQLLMRSLDRASRINRAMLARVYDSKRIHKAKRPKLTRNDWIYLAAWPTIILFIRFIDISAIIDKWLSTHLT